jgi:phosphoglycolate phosphatase
MLQDENLLPIRAIVIDLDGTLLDTAPDLAVAANRMLADLGFSGLDADVIKSFIGKGIGNLVRRCLGMALGRQEPDEALLETALASFTAHYERNLCNGTQRYPGVVEGLAAIRAAGFRLGCITNKATKFTLPLLEQTEIAHFFELTVCGDTLPEKKPHPLPLLHSAKVFGVSPSELLLIGDSANDTEAARAAGCPVFCVSYGYHAGYELEELEAVAIVDSLQEVARLIRLPARHGEFTSTDRLE